MRYPIFKTAGRPLPFQMRRPLAASVEPDMGQLLTIDSSGRANVSSATAPNRISFGAADRDQDAGAAAGDASMVAWCTFVSQYQNSSIANDAFTDADVGVVAWSAGESTFGKLSNSSGNRSMLGLCFGLDGETTPLPLVWVGPVAWCVARAVHMADGKSRAWLDIADAAASTATAERAIPQEKMHGRVTAVEFCGAAIAADNTDYVTITVAKRSVSDAYAAATTIATYDSRAANQGAITAFTPAAFALSGTSANLDVLETDVITITVVKGGSGKVLTGAFRVVTKVQ